MDESDYISKNDVGRSLLPKRVKVETPQPNTLPSQPPSSSSRGRKRPRRTAATSVRSYAVPDSDDEAIAQSDDPVEDQEDKKVTGESSLQLWIKNLSLLLKVETRKVREFHRKLTSNANGQTV